MESEEHLASRDYSLGTWPIQTTSAQKTLNLFSAREEESQRRDEEIQGF
jgi:hypothetical protein